MSRNHAKTDILMNLVTTPPTTGEAFSGIDELLGVSEQYNNDTSDKATFTDSEENALTNLLKNGSDGNTLPIDQQQTDPKEKELPEYFLPYKDQIGKPLPKIEADTTDYSQRAVQEFGQGFASINTRDAFTAQLVYNSTLETLQDQHEHYNQLVLVEKGQMDKETAVRDVLRDKMQKKADSDFEVFSQEEYDTKIGKLFTDGKLNAEGEKIYNTLAQGWLNNLKAIRQDLQNKAVSAVQSHKANQAALETEAKGFNILGMTLEDDLKDNVLNFIRSGELEKWEKAENLTPQEYAQRTLMKALFANPTTLNFFLEKFAERSEDYGMNKVARRKF